MTKDTFKKNWLILMAAFLGSKVTDETQRVYWRALQTIPDDIFREGIGLCVSSCKFFPTISEIGESCYGTESAWRTYLAGMRRAHAKRRQALPAPDEQGRVKALISDLVEKVKP